jgi:nucleotide-binding universal stress UspA family protein
MLDELAELRKAWEFSLLLLQVWEPLPFTPPEASFYDEGHLITYRKAADKRGRAILGEVERKASELGLSVSEQLVDSGDPASTILDCADAKRVGWIAMTSHQRHGPSRWFLGSVAEKVAAGARCPVFTVPSH